jgi:hypothetical protein
VFTGRLYRYIAAFSLLLLLGSIALPLFKVAADTQLSSWLKPEMPTLEKIADLAPGQLPPYRLNGNRDCEQRKVITRQENLLVGTTEQSHDSCVVSALFGGASASGYVQMTGSSIFGRLTYAYGGSLYNFLAPPHSRKAMYFGSSPNNGVAVYFINDFAQSINATTIYNGEVTYSLKPTFAPTSLRDKANNLLAVDVGSIAFSPNGRWMLADAPGRGQLRINLDTLEVLPFGTPFNYNIGLTPGLQTAITNDGRYAIVASGDFHVFSVYDLSTCGAVPNQITGPVSCQSRNLQDFMAQNLHSFLGVNNIRFTSDYSMQLYANYRSPAGAFQRSQFTLTAAGETASGYGYLALGDSFASGEGAYDYKSVTDTSENKCHLSLRSYPYLIGDGLNLNSYESVACSGAVINDVTSQDIDYEGQVSDHIKFKNRTNIPEILQSFLPGYIAQKSFINEYRPNIITISAVGNDVGFDDKVKRCLEPDTCYGSYEDRLEIIREINDKFDRMTTMYTELKQSLDPRAKIYVLGYPKVVKPHGDCGVNVHLNERETVFADELVDYLNSVIEAAARKVGVYYVDISNALAGHRLCETAYSDTAVNGLTNGNDIVDFLFIHGPVANESFHPNAMGHRLLKETILSKTGNLTAAMPAPDDTAVPPSEDNQPLLDAPKDGRPINRLNFDNDAGNNVAVREAWWFSAIGGDTLKPNTPVNVWLNSDPVHLGSFTTNEQGNLNFQVKIPASVPIGFHTLHIYGINWAGEPVDIYKTLYVAASETDIDGDGIANTAEACLAVERAGQDYDKDGTDDACDGNITEPPAETPIVLKAEDQSTTETEKTTFEQESVLIVNTGGQEQVATTLETTPKLAQDNATEAGQVLAANINNASTGSQQQQAPATAAHKPDIHPGSHLKIWFVVAGLVIVTITALIYFRFTID